MKGFVCTVFALSLIGGTAALAEDHGDYGHHDASHHNDRVHWSRGDHFSGHSVDVDDWRGHHLRKPPRGYHWVQNDDGDFVLVAIGTGIILDLLLNAH